MSEELAPEVYVRLLAALEELERIGLFATGLELVRNPGALTLTEPAFEEWPATGTGCFTLLDVNGARKGASIYNNTTGLTLYVKLGKGASSSSFTVLLNPGDYYELPANYRGRVTAAWSAAGAGEAFTTEFGW